MRLTDDRYNNERASIDVAIRMIRFEARSCTIRTCTGLTDDRIRKLYRSYVVREQAARVIKRRRGKSPREIDSLLCTAETQLQTSLLAGTFVALGLFDATSNAQRNDLVLLAAKLCDAYDVYTQLLTDRPLSFEHAWFLWHALAKKTDLYLRTCTHCGGLAVQDRFTLRIRPCPWCGTKERAEGHDDFRRVNRSALSNQKTANQRTART